MDKNAKRYYVILCLMFIFIAAAIGRLASLQIVHGEENREKSLSRTQRTVTLPAARGEMLDRYGRAMVINRMGFSVTYHRQKGMKDEEINRTITEIADVLNASGIQLSEEMPISKDAPYSFIFDDETGAAEKAWKSQMELPDVNASEIIGYYKEQFNVSDEYTDKQVRIIVGVRYSMLIRGFSTTTSYTLAKDVPMSAVTAIKNKYPGINIMTEPIRDYVNGTLGVHVLGRIGNIDADEYETLSEKGYTLNDQLGKEGLEKYLENELRGTRGTAVVEQDEKGHYIGITPVEEAVSGNSVYLTIDLDVQKAAENMLEETINKIRTSAAETNGAGSDVAGGAAVAVDVKTGELLCVANYPSYDVTQFSKNYRLLYENPLNPMFNRAFSGTYAPGSTFKMLVAMAALDTGVIEPDTVIEDKVAYSLGGSIFTCMENHGAVDIRHAIGGSCNYFFYSVGYDIGIETLDKYAEAFGFGKRTGVELYDEPGVVASPKVKEARGEPWYGGYVLQASIGQDDNKFTPLQLACYTAQIANGGTRYTPHLVKSIRTYKDKQVIKEMPITVADSVELDPVAVKTVQEGMRLVATEGTAARTFSDYPIAVAAKTGTAQVANGSDNAVFVAYAPYDDPQIAVAVVIERGGHGSDCAPVARAIFDAYLNADNAPDNIPAIDSVN